MVRRLPWQVGSDSKKRTLSDASPSAIPSKRNKRAVSPASDLDLVDADLNLIFPSTPKRHRALQNPNKSPSTSPPPAPPSVSYMREGFDADDKWMMVEDEFLATAKLYTQHLHHAAYAEAKRRAAARGQDTLRGLQRRGDGRTEQSFQTKIKREAKGNRTKFAGEEEDEDAEEEGEWLDPQLAVLMNSRQETVMLGKEGRRLGKVRSETRAAKGFLRSPEKARTAKDVALRQSPTKKSTYSRKEELEQSKEADDSDDLDGPVRMTTALKRNKPAASKAPKRSESMERSRKAAGIFKQFSALSASAKDVKTPTKPKKSNTSDLFDWRPQDHQKAAPKSSGAFELGEFGMFGKSTAKDDAAEYLAKKKAAREKSEKRGLSDGRKSASNKAKETDYADVPTFLI